MCINYYQNKIDESQPLVLGNISITLKSKKEKFPGFIVRSLLISKTNHCDGERQEQREVMHYQECEWYDNCSPDKNTTVDMHQRLTYLIAKVKQTRTFHP